LERDLVEDHADLGLEADLEQGADRVPVRVHGVRVRDWKVHCCVEVCAYAEAPRRQAVARILVEALNRFIRHPPRWTGSIPDRGLGYHPRDREGKGFWLRARESTLRCVRRGASLCPPLDQDTTPGCALLATNRATLFVASRYRQSARLPPVGMLRTSGCVRDVGQRRA